MPELNLTVNGVAHTLDVPHNRFLAEVLRYDLGLTGTKIGCNEAECGACTVLVNGRSVDSCIYPAFKAQGAHVLTVEGLADTWPDDATCTRCRRPSSRTAPPSAASARPAFSCRPRPCWTRTPTPATTRSSIA